MSLSVNLCNSKYIQTDWQIVVTFHLLALELNPIFFFTIGRDLHFDSVAFINMVSHQLIFVDFANSKVLRICLWFGYNMFLSIETINIIFNWRTLKSEPTKITKIGRQLKLKPQLALVKVELIYTLYDVGIMAKLLSYIEWSIKSDANLIINKQ